MSVRVEVLYFAALRDAAGVASELLQTSAGDLAALYAEVRQAHDLPFSQATLRVAQDGAFASWDAAPRDGATVAFIPPVSGG